LHAEVSQPVFLGCVWALAGLSLIFVLVRCFIKMMTFKRVSSDDVIAFIAWGMFLANIILWTVKSPILYRNYEVLQGKHPFDQVEIERYGSFIRCIGAFTSIFYASLWSVKLSVLLFFRRLGNQIRRYEIWWWCVTAVTVSTWLICMADVDWPCNTKPIQWIMLNCSSQNKINFQNRTFYANCALDILSDCLIVSIPILILWNVHVPLRKKIILTGIFSATVIVMVVSIIRVTVVNSKHQSAEIAWLVFWSFVENGTAIMISCVASFRQLFVASQDQ
ncbi:uncharacterized protein BDR25DRAFT_151954, partial [Lindgomyces ingoldianus]